MSISHFVNKGKFFDKHPDIIGNVTKFERTDEQGVLLEYWVRNDEGIMVDKTEEEKLRREISKAEADLEELLDD